MKSYIYLSILLYFAISQVSFAQDDFDDFDFKVNNQTGLISIKRYKGEATIVKIPSNYEGLRVTVISGYKGKDKQYHGAFEEMDIDSVEIPTSIIRIEKNAFYNCDELKHITLPSSIRIIQESAFEGCSNLRRVSISKNLSVMSNRLFADCGSLKEVTIPNRVNTIGDEVFLECINLSKVTIPNSVNKIGFSAFADCNKLMELRVESLHPPVVGAGFLYNTPKQLSIKVPESKVSLYKKSPGWSEYANQIIGYP